MLEHFHQIGNPHLFQARCQIKSRLLQFREDLYFRLNVFPIRVPALRDRLEDIPVFMYHFLRKFCAMHERRVRGFSARAVDAMLAYQWPGNIRELENVIERGVILAPEDGVIDVAQLFSGGEEIPRSQLHLNRGGGLTQSSHSDPEARSDHAERAKNKVSRIWAGVLDENDPTTMQDIEDSLIESALTSANGNLSAAARALGMSRAKLVYWKKSRAASSLAH